MKNLLKLTVVGVFGVVALTSCKKDWTCECAANIGGVTIHSDTLSPVLSDLSKKDAQTSCDAHANTLSTAMPGITCTAVEK